MPYPSKLITDSDLSSTPASLSGGRKITLTTPANVSCNANSIVSYESTIAISEEFDMVDYIITIDELPDVNVYNGYTQEYGPNVTLWGSVEVSGNIVKLAATFGSLLGGTFPASRTFRAIIIPIKSPFSQ